MDMTNGETNSPTNSPLFDRKMATIEGLSFDGNKFQQKF